MGLGSTASRWMAAVGLLCALCAGASSAATIEYDVQPRVLRLGESATCRITIRGGAGAPAPSLPPIPSFDVSSTGTEQNYSITPQGHESSVTYVYRLSPRELGTFTIGPFAYALGNDQVTLPAVEIKVLAPGANAGTSPTQRLDDLLFATLTAPRPYVYVQQSFEMTLSIFSQGLNLDREIRLLDFNTAGLRIEGYDELATTREAVNNQIYDVRRFRVRATALTAGGFSLAPRLRLNVVVPNQRRDPIDSFFGDFFARVQTRPVDVAARPLALEVRDLPAAGRPAGFSGAVGQFTFDVEARPLQLRIGDPVTLTMTLRGSRNMAGLTPPGLDFGDEFKVYEPRLISDAGDASQRIFEQVVIPRSASATNLPSIEFSFFDPYSETYQTLQKGPFTLALDTAGASGPLVFQGSGRPAAAAPTSIGHDIVYLKSAPRHWQTPAAKSWYASPAVIALHAVPPVALAALLVLVRRRERLAGDTARARREQAPRSARKAMAEAEATLRGADITAFYESIARVLSTYFGHRFDLAPGQVTGDIVGRRLQDAGLPTPELSELGQLFAECEARRFGATGRADFSDAEREAARTRLHRLNHLLRRCERLRL